MANTFKVLGQAAPTDTANVNLYTVPSGTAAVVSTLHVANTTTDPATCRIFVRVLGASAVAGNALTWDVELAGNSLLALTEGISLSAGDIVTVRSSVANALTFQLFGSEIV